MSISIRAARADDFENFAKLCAVVDQLHINNLPRIFKEAQGEPAKSEVYFSKVLNDPLRYVWFAEENGRAVGMICGNSAKSPDTPIHVQVTNFFITNFVVLESHQKQGIGKLLHKTAAAKARELGAAEIQLVVYAFNKSALEFYRKMGFGVDSHWMSMPVS